MIETPRSVGPYRRPHIKTSVEYVSPIQMPLNMLPSLHPNSEASAPPPTQSTWTKQRALWVSYRFSHTPHKTNERYRQDALGRLWLDEWLRFPQGTVTYLDTGASPGVLPTVWWEGTVGPEDTKSERRMGRGWADRGV